MPVPLNENPNRVDHFARLLVEAANSQAALNRVEEQYINDPNFRRALHGKEKSPEDIVINALAKAIAKTRSETHVDQLSDVIAKVKAETPKRVS